jgi:antitoxin MazE
MRQPDDRSKGKTGPVARARLVKMGNSRGIRLPSLFLDEVDLDEEVEVEVQDGQVVIRLVPRPRRKWEEHSAEMAARGDDRLLDSKAFSLSSWDEEKWVW